MMVQKMKKKKIGGFTLIELIVVIAILGILAVIAIPRFGGMRESANLKAITSNLRTIQNAVEIIATEKNIEIKELATTDTDGTITAGTNLTANDLKDLLGTWPKGPGTTTYIVSATGEATANVPSDLPLPVATNPATYTLKTILSE
jgi:prepilin-type N-terminal cleavage/methylation domain-containing protein